MKKAFLIRENNIPTFLREMPNWVIWKYERAISDKPGAKQRKVPYYPEGGKRSGVLGRPEDIAGMSVFDDAVEHAKHRNFDGVGLAILPEQNITVIDLDDCISDTGVYSDFAQELIEGGSYVERSPSGRGLRAVYHGALIQNQKRDFHIDNGERVEVYCGKAYTTFTGNKLPSIERDAVTKLPKAIKVKLLTGLGSVTRPDGGFDDSLASMNAIALPSMTTGQAARILAGLPARWGASGEGTWYQAAAAMHMQFGGSEEAYAVLDAWSAERDGYDEVGNRARWEAGFAHAQGKQTVTSMRNLVFEAKSAGVGIKAVTMEAWGLARKKVENKPAGKDDTGIELPDDEVDPEIAAAWVPVDLGEWVKALEKPAPTPMLIPGWLTDENVTLFSSTGGSGKSFVALSLLALAAVGEQTWFGASISQGCGVFVSAEDPKQDILHRLWGVCGQYGLDRGAVAKCLDVVDIANLLHRALYEGGDYGRAEFTKQYRLLEALVQTGKYKYVVLDNVSEFFAANENSRSQVAAFVGSLKRLAMQHKVAIILLGHPAKAEGSGYSGSTAWHNSTRVRWSLEQDKSDGSRKLVVERITHSVAGKAGKWAWSDSNGVLAMGDACGAGSASAEFAGAGLAEALYDAVLAITEDGGHVPASVSGPVGIVDKNPGVISALLNMRIDQKQFAKHIRDGLVALKDERRLVEEQYRTSGRVLKMGYQIPIL